MKRFFARRTTRRHVPCAAALTTLVLTTLCVAPAAATSGDDLFKAGDFAGAQTAYRAALLADPKDAAANLGLARVELYANHLEDAKDQAARALRLNGPDERLSRIIAEVAAREAISKTAATLNVPAAGAIIPFIATDPLPLMRLKIDGREANVLLDTGAPDLAIDPDFAKELKLKPTNTGEVGHFAGNRTRVISTVAVDTVNVGGITIHHLTAPLIPSRNLPFFGTRKVDAVVGTIFLSRFLSTIDYPKGRLELFPRSSANSVRNAIVAPFWLVGDHFIFTRGAANDAPEALMLVDSGLAGGGFMPSETTIKLAHIKTQPQNAGTGIGGGGEVQFVPLTVDRLCLSTACRTNVPGMYTPGGSPLVIFPFEAAGVISHEFLKNYAVTIDFNAMNLTLNPGPT